MDDALDPRLTPARADLAAESLRDRVQAPRYAPPRPRVVGVPVAPMTATPDGEAPTTTHLLYGETFDAYEIRNGWAWGQATLDGYVGYVPDACLDAPGAAATHRVDALQAPVHPEPTVRSRPVGALPFAARVALDGAARDGFVALAAGGWLSAAHVAPLADGAADWVATARRFLGAPYLWGGRTAAGVDCSGLVQLARQAAGLPCPRDSDQQRAAPGRDVAEGRLRRGDLVFWAGHVGIMVSPSRLLHATGWRMAVIEEPLAEVEARIAAQGHGSALARRRWS